MKGDTVVTFRETAPLLTLLLNFNLGRSKTNLVINGHVCLLDWILWTSKVQILRKSRKTVLWPSRTAWEKILAKLDFNSSDQSLSPYRPTDGQLKQNMDGTWVKSFAPDPLKCILAKHTLGNVCLASTHQVMCTKHTLGFAVQRLPGSGFIL